MEGSLREVTSNQLILNSTPFPLISKLTYTFDETHVKHLSMSDQI